MLLLLIAVGAFDLIVVVDVVAAAVVVVDGVVAITYVAFYGLEHFSLRLDNSNKPQKDCSGINQLFGLLWS